MTSVGKTPETTRGLAATVTCPRLAVTVTYLCAGEPIRPSTGLVTLHDETIYTFSLT
jgi:hypothetical protein